VKPKGKNGRALPGFFSFFACTDAESLEHPGRGLQNISSGVFLQVSAYYAGAF
jgi:hypothetical protein